MAALMSFTSPALLASPVGRSNSLVQRRIAQPRLQRAGFRGSVPVRALRICAAAEPKSVRKVRASRRPRVDALHLPSAFIECAPSTESDATNSNLYAGGYGVRARHHR